VDWVGTDVFYCQGELLLQWLDWENMVRGVLGDLIGHLVNAMTGPFPRNSRLTLRTGA